MNLKRSIEFHKDGVHFVGTLQRLKDVVNYLRTHEQVKDFPGVRKPKAQIMAEPQVE